MKRASLFLITLLLTASCSTVTSIPSESQESTLSDNSHQSSNDDTSDQENKILDSSVSSNEQTSVSSSVDDDSDLLIIENGVVVGYTGNPVTIRIPEGVTEIADNVFGHCWSLRNVHLPNTLKIIGKENFGSRGESSVTRIFIPSSVEEISTEGIGNGKIIYCEVDAKPEGWAYSWTSGSTNIMTYWGVGPDFEPKFEDGIEYYEKEGEKVLVYDWNYEIGRKHSSGTIEIPDEYTEIGHAPFSCIVQMYQAHSSNPQSRLDFRPSLDSLVIPTTIKNIYAYAFEGLDAKTVVWPANVKTVKNSTFTGAKLTHLELPQGIEDIELRGLSNMRNLETLVLPDSIKTLGDSFLEDCIKLKEIRFGGTKEQWNKLQSSKTLKDSAVERIICRDGTIDIAVN